MADKTELINKIVMGMYTDLGQELSKKLEATLYICLSGYDLTEKVTDIVKYEENETDRLVKKFIIAKKLKNCSDRTLKYYKVTLDKVFRTVNKNPIQVSTDNLRMYFFNRQLIDKVSATTINDERRVLSSFFAWLAVEEIRLQNPMLKIDQLKEKKEKKEAFTDYELELMRSQLKDLKDIAVYEVLISTWARVSEIANIRLDEIKGDQCLVHGKGNKDRYVFLTPKAQIAIQRYLAERNDNNPYLFTRRAPGKVGTKKGWWKDPSWVDKDAPGEVNTIEVFVRTLGRKNGIVAHPHKFRRTGATMALRRGMPIMTVSKVLGHESIETTQIYLDISDDELKQAHMKYC